MDLGLRNKRALVTAASRGLGLASARALATEGARVAMASSIGRGVDEVIRRWGGIDILITNTPGPMAGVHHQPRILAGGPQHAPANVCF